MGRFSARRTAQRRPVTSLGDVNATDALEIPLAINLVAVFVGALGGTLRAGEDEKTDLVGVFTLAAAMGFGGGVVRDVLLGNLPPNAIITDAYLHRVVASNAATTATVALGTAEAGAQIMAAADIKGTGKVGSLVGQILTGSGKPLYAALTITGAQTAGKFYVVVEYLEPNKVTGELTKVT